MIRKFENSAERLSYIRQVIAIREHLGLAELIRDAEIADDGETKLFLAKFYNERGNSLLKQGAGSTLERIRHLNEIVIDFTIAVRLDPQRPFYKTDLAVAYFELGRLKTDETLIRKGISLYEECSPPVNDTASQFNIGYAFHELAKLPLGTIEDFTKARYHLELALRNKEIVHLCFLEIGRSFLNEVEKFGLERPLVASAIIALKQVIFSGKIIGEASLYLGKAFYLILEEDTESAFSEAIACFIKAEASGLQSWELYFTWAETISKYASLNNYQSALVNSALSVYEKAISVDLLEYQTYLSTGKTLLHASINEQSTFLKIDEAIVYLKKAHDIYYYSATIHLYLGKSYFALAKAKGKNLNLLQTAREYYEYARDTSSSTFNDYAELASLYYDMGIASSDPFEYFIACVRHIIKAHRVAPGDLPLFKQTLLFLPQLMPYNLKELETLITLIADDFNVFEHSEPKWYAEHVTLMNKLKMYSYQSIQLDHVG
jgi:tetratricopeptide (TPR) repeat protein